MKFRLTPEAPAIQAEKVRQLYASLPSALIANAIVGVVLLSLQMGIAPARSLMFWGLAMLFVLILRLLLYTEYRQAAQADIPATDMGRWLQLFRIFSLATGLVWAMAAVVMFPSAQDVSHLTILAFILSGMSGGGTASLGADMLSVLGYSIPAVLVLAIRLFADGGTLQAHLGGVALLFLGFLIVSARRNQRLLMETAMLRDSDRRNAAELREQQRNLRSILDNAPIGIWRQDRQGRLLFVNRYFCDKVGIPEAKFLSVHHYAVLYPEDIAQRCIASDMAAYVSSSPHVCHERLIFTDGNIHDMEITKFRLEDMQGELDGLIGIAADRTDAIKLEQELRDKESRFRMILENSLDAIITVNHRGVVTDWNPEAERMLGHKAGSAIGRDLAELIIPEALRDEHRQGMSRFLASGEHHILGSRMEVEALHADGHVFPIEISISKPASYNGEQFFSAFIRDLTLQKETQSKLDASLHQLEAVLDNVADAIITADEHGRMLSFNSMAEHIFGYAASEMLGQNVNLLMPEPDHSRHDGYIRHFVETGEARVMGARREVDALRKDGTRFPAKLGISYTIQGGRPIFIALIQDISDAKRAEAELKAGRDRAQKALQELRQQKFALDQHAIVAVTDVQGRIIYANDRFCAISGYSRDELLGQDHAMLNSGTHPHGFFKAMYRTVAQGETWHGEVCNRAKDGHLYWVDTTIAPFIGEDGKPTQYISIRSDITKLKETEAELTRHRDHLQDMVMERTADLVAAKERAEQANQAKSEFLANMSHELRTPMHAILSFSELGVSKAETAPPEKLKGYFERVQHSGTRLLDLLNDLLDLSKLEAGKMELERQPHDLVQLARETLAEFEPLIQSNGLESIIEASGNTIADVDAKRLSQVLRNLISNAVKFTPPGGTITLRFRDAELPRGRRETDTDMVSAVRMEIADTGVGIPENELELIFDKFVQSSLTKSNAGGTGLGLPICREIVTAHHGVITAQRNPGGGSCFVVVLPCRVPSPFMQREEESHE